MELAESFETNDAKVWTVKLSPGRRLPRRQDPLLRRRGLLAQAATSTRRSAPRSNSIAKQFVDIKAVDPLDRRDHAGRARTPTCRPSWPLHHFMIVAGRHHGLLQGQSAPALSRCRAVRAGRAVDRRAQQELLQGAEGAVSTPSSSSPSPTRTPASTPCSRATSSSPPRSSRVRYASSRASPASSSSKTTVGQLHQPQHAPRHGAGRQGRLRRGHEAICSTASRSRSRRCAASPRSPTTSRSRR